jgi:hypothetical protein
MVEHQSGTLSDPALNLPEAIFQQGELQSEASPPVAVEAAAVAPDLDTEDWYSKLREDELFNGPEGPAPRLHGLRRLARQFIKSERSQVNALIVVPRQVKQVLEHHNGDGQLMSTNEVIRNENFTMLLFKL